MIHKANPVDATALIADPTIDADADAGASPAWTKLAREHKPGNTFWTFVSTPCTTAMD